MSIQEKFEKAVNVIRNLPKNGSYQPSHELQLRFYAYYKQATEGPNDHPKPNFWEVVKKAKWDAWAKLGNMTKEEAMMHYVEELRKIVETMSYTDNVATFLNSLDNFYENVPAADLELLVGPIIEKIRSRPGSPLSGSPLASRDTSPSRTALISRDTSPLRLTANNVGHPTPKHMTSSLETSPASSYSASPLPPDTDDDEDDHFLDTQTEPDRSREANLKKGRSNTGDQGREIPVDKLTVRSLQGSKPGALSNGEVISRDTEPTITAIWKDVEQIKNRLHSVETSLVNQPKQVTCSTVEAQSVAHQTLSPGSSTAASEAFRRAIDNMTKEVENIQRRMATLEGRRLQEANISRRKTGNVLPRWWGLSLQTTAFLLAWPFIVMLISRWLLNRRKP